MKVETFVNKTIHYHNWDMSQTPFFFYKIKVKKKKKKENQKHNFIQKRPTKKKKKNQNPSHILTIQIILNKKSTLQGVLVYLRERLNLPSL